MHARAVRWAHQKGVYANLHSCGDVMSLMDDILVTGVDALNPLEVKAGMDSLLLKQEVYKRQVHARSGEEHGGGVFRDHGSARDHGVALGLKEFEIQRAQLARMLDVHGDVYKRQSVNNAVITADGLAGRVYEVGLNYAKVRSIIHSTSSVACLIQRTRDNGVLTGQVDVTETDECQMNYLPNGSSVVPGDTVVTSGVDMLFPKGLMVGTVTAVSRQTDTTRCV